MYLGPCKTSVIEFFLSGSCKPSGLITLKIIIFLDHLQVIPPDCVAPKNSYHVALNLRYYIK